MRSNRDIQSLAAEMAKRHEDRQNPYILFLGTGGASAAGVPHIEEMARQVFYELYNSDPDMANKYLPEEDQKDSDKLVKSFHNLLSSLSPRQRYRVLQRFYTSIPVPLFYQDLAVLIKTGYFNRVLTTNVDTLLEQALQGAGLRYQVISFGMDEISNTFLQPKNISDYPVMIFKLHGDLARRQVQILPQEIEAALKPQSDFVLYTLMNDIIMVGYEFESNPVNESLKKPEGGELWWINQTYRDSKQMVSMEKVRNLIYIDQLSASPADFFGKLVLLLLRVPVLATMGTSFEDYTASLRSKGTSTKTGLSDDELETEYLRNQLQRTQEVLYSLKQATVVGEKNIQLQNQIEYQEYQIAELEERLKNLSLREHT